MSFVLAIACIIGVFVAFGMIFSLAFKLCGIIYIFFKTIVLKK